MQYRDMRRKEKMCEREKDIGSVIDTATASHHQLTELKWHRTGASTKWCASQGEINDCALIERSKAYSISGQ